MSQAIRKMILTNIEAIATTIITIELYDKAYRSGGLTSGNSNSKITNNNYYEKVVNEFVEYLKNSVSPFCLPDGPLLVLWEGPPRHPPTLPTIIHRIGIIPSIHLFA